MYSHTIVVYFYIRIPKNLVNVGSSRHELPRHRKNCVGNTDPSGQNWSDTVCRRRHVATCRQHFQLSHPKRREIVPQYVPPHAHLDTQPPHITDAVFWLDGACLFIVWWLYTATKCIFSFYFSSLESPSTITGNRRSQTFRHS